ncbi:mechanosensitive ion channel family protein [Streptomyces candidus]|uniref:Small-conductance mechanosensitive channel n=1 Tax=Streptomyces candidus TaxID=67283 RepID=A0A7X0H9T9_9ACTN|nr:mechanosensitive ion channel domain-containing protein [Streptomyces candidus]MBB6433716.1 small-conductance mechanosensitive channel [Streptomyces candidus]GHH34871.1 mechanosensitive ion channel protein [Streptomyces candidus]
MENVLRPLIVLGGSVVLTLLLGWAVDLVLRRADARHHETPLWGLLRRCRPPLMVVLLTAFLRGAYDQTDLTLVQEHEAGIGQGLSLVLIAATAWLIVRVASTVVESTYARYASLSRDAARVRRVRTQVTLIMRIVTAVVGVIAVSAMLMTFPDMQAIGKSMLASAGIIGIVAGVAAQSTLGNLFAGFQIAFGDMVRLGDTVVVDGEWGVVEEVTLTFLAVRTWDERRITMPVSYFTSKPFQNWSRGGAQMTGTVFLQLDHRAPVAAMRVKLREILAATPSWDGRDWSLAVTDTTASTMEVRVVVTAKDADDIWTARCAVREQLIDWLCTHHPYALPKVNTAEAVPPPSGQWPSQASPNGRAPRAEEIHTNNSDIRTDDDAPPPGADRADGRRAAAARGHQTRTGRG